MSLTDLTGAIKSGKTLSEAETKIAVESLLDTQIAEVEKSAFLTAQIQRGVTCAELVEFARALLVYAVAPTFTRQWQGQDILDCCGTGGGGLNILNVSTGLIFILAAAGVPVVKHGNRGVTKKSGSADVLEALGLRVELTPAQLAESLDKLGWGFVYAPAFHPAFKAVTPVRKALAAQGQRTIFNYLGPLLNPVRPGAQLVGVFRENDLALYSEALTALGCRKHAVVYGRTPSGQALGELTTTGTNKTAGLAWENGEEFFSPSEDFQKLQITSATDSAGRIEKILRGAETGLARDLFIMNAGVALQIQGKVARASAGFALAREMIESGAAYRVLEKSRAWAQTHPMD